MKRRKAARGKAKTRTVSLRNFTGKVRLNLGTRKNPGGAMEVVGVGHLKRKRRKPAATPRRRGRR